MVTIVVLTTGYPEHVIKDLENQTYKDFEIILATEKGIVNAMNIALGKAKGDIFARVDDDVRIPSDWLQRIVDRFEDHKVGGVTGPTLVPLEYRQNRDSIKYAEYPNWFLRWLFDGDPYAVARIYKSGSVSYGSNFEEHLPKEWGLRIVDHLEGTNWAMRTELIRKVGGFDPLFDGVAEWYDTDVEQKIKKLGYKLVYNTNASLWHLLSKGKNFEKRYNGWGRIKNWLRFHSRHSKFHYKKVVYLCLFIAYTMYRSLFRP